MKRMLGKNIVSCLLALILLVGGLATCAGGGAAPPMAIHTPDTKAQLGEEENDCVIGNPVPVIVDAMSTSGHVVANRSPSVEIRFNGMADAIAVGLALDEVVRTRSDAAVAMMLHDMSHPSYLFGASGKQHSLDAATVGRGVGRNPGTCLETGDNVPYSSLVELARWLADNPDDPVRVMEAGDVSRIAFAGDFLWAEEKHDARVRDRIRLNVSGSTAEKLQIVWDDSAEAIFAHRCALQQDTGPAVDGDPRAPPVAGRLCAR